MRADGGTLHYSIPQQDLYKLLEKLQQEDRAFTIKQLKQLSPPSTLPADYDIVEIYEVSKDINVGYQYKKAVCSLPEKTYSQMIKLSDLSQEEQDFLQAQHKTHLEQYGIK